MQSTGPRVIGRRELLRCGAWGTTAVVAGSGLLSRLSRALAPPVSLSMDPALVEMVDTTRVFHWTFQLEGADFPSFPGPTIFASTGDAVVVRVTNRLDEPHEFRILGAGPGGGDIVSSPAVLAPGATATVSFTPRTAGTFLYADPRNAPVNRVLGLHGAFVVLPAGVRENSPVNTPYTSPTPALQRLFDDLGRTAAFPGEPWIPVRPAGAPARTDLPPDVERFLFRTNVWVLANVDPRFNAIAEAGGNAEPGGAIDAATFLVGFLPRYFLIGGRSGVFASHDPQLLIEGFVGEPRVVRILNAGLVTPSLHLHANHFFVLAVNGVPLDNVHDIDSMTMNTVEGDRTPGALARGDDLFVRGGSRMDWLVPFIRPQDIPGDPNRPLRDVLAQELALVIGDVPMSPLRYPMHDHMEPSQTAAGGNYPQGTITDFFFLGDLDKVPFPGSGTPGGACNGPGMP